MTKTRLRDFAADLPQAYKPDRPLTVQDEQRATRIAWILVALAIVVFLTVTAHCETLPDAPALGTPAETHQRLFTRENLVAFSLNVGIRSVDVYITCHNLGSGGHEFVNQTQSCAGNAAMILSVVPLQMVCVKLAQPNHRKIAAFCRWGAPVSDVPSVIYSLSHAH